MMPGMNPRMMKQAMKRMGIKQEEIEATEVIIKTPEKEIIISEPSVSKVNMMGQETWQVAGEAVERDINSEPEINEEDINTVVEQTGVSEDKAREVIEKHKGDLAAAIMELQNS
ncbi:MAG: nascent polypeptide-associated complex protein [Nanoarchaeota archaeon]|nr:nascent polypeptide-associated complex protein [Nanoarchaeota archaeon]